jgi:hypothetical protein
MDLSVLITMACLGTPQRTKIYQDIRKDHSADELDQAP